MILSPMDILKEHPVRKNSKQKSRFRKDIADYLAGLGYEVTEEKGSFGAVNMIIGDPEKARYLVTAHYDTCAAMILPNFITPCNPLIYWLYQIFVVALMAAVAIAAGVVTGFVFPNGVKPVSLAVYWLVLVFMMFGPANINNANDNTSGVITVLEILRSLPENQRSKACFVLFDMEELGLIGSAAYRKAHKKATENQLVLNLDCVGDGDAIRFFPTKKLKKDKKRLSSLYRSCGYFGEKSILVHEKDPYIYPSDQKNFPWGVGICALKKGRIGLYMNRIHTKKDTILEQTNVNLLRAAIITFISGDAAQ